MVSILAIWIRWPRQQQWTGNWLLSHYRSWSADNLHYEDEIASFQSWSAIKPYKFSTWLVYSTCNHSVCQLALSSFNHSTLHGFCTAQTMCKGLDTMKDVGLSQHSWQKKGGFFATFYTLVIFFRQPGCDQNVAAIKTIKSKIYHCICIVAHSNVTLKGYLQVW